MQKHAKAKSKSPFPCLNATGSTSWPLLKNESTWIFTLKSGQTCRFQQPTRKLDLTDGLRDPDWQIQWEKVMMGVRFTPGTTSRIVAGMTGMTI